ncbi:hypothetical protein ACLI08_13915 [Flavobacterium sp. RNTU_13]
MLKLAVKIRKYFLLAAEFLSFLAYEQKSLADQQLRGSVAFQKKH